MLITVLFFMRVKAERDEEWRGMLTQAIRSTHSEDEGCISYSFYRQIGTPLQYVLHEQWRDADALNAHVARLQRLWGPPPEGGSLPAAFFDLMEQTEAISYEVVT